MIDISQFPEYDEHKYLLRFHEPQSMLTGYIAIHRSDALRPAFGATRLWKYGSEKEAAADALRLSKGMSRKSALAGLKYGGAKAVIMEPNQPYDRKKLLKAYANVVNDLHGQFITGTDVGLTQEDVLEMKKHSRYFVGVSVDPTTYTALGLLSAIQSTLSFLYGNSDLTNRSFAIQGTGKIGSELISLLYPHTKQITITDIDDQKIKNLLAQYPDLKVSTPEDIHRNPVDIFAPCALSGSINSTSIHELACKAVVGGANNQLEHTGIADELARRGILYAPDYIVNAGGLISVVSEFEDQGVKHEALTSRVAKIGSLVTDLFSGSNQERISTTELAERMAQQYLKSF